MRRPSLALTVAINHAVREHDEWFDEPDDFDRIKRAIAAIEDIYDPIEAAAVVACRVSRAQGFTEETSGQHWCWLGGFSTGMA